MPVSSPRLSPVLLAFQLQIQRAPINPSLGFDNLLEWLAELRKVLYLLLQIYYKIQIRNSQIKEMHRAGYGGRGVELPCSLQVHHRPSTSLCSPTWSSPKPQCLVGFREISLGRNYWLNHWPLMINLISSHSSLPQMFQTSNHALVSLVTSPHPEASRGP